MYSDVSTEYLEDSISLNKFLIHTTAGSLVFKWYTYSLKDSIENNTCIIELKKHTFCTCLFIKPNGWLASIPISINKSISYSEC